MSRISEVDPRKAGLIQGLFARMAFMMSKWKVGKVVVPVKVLVHHPRVLWGYGQMDEAVKNSGKVEAALLNLVHLRAATLIGCVF